MGEYFRNMFCLTQSLCVIEESQVADNMGVEVMEEYFRQLEGFKKLVDVFRDGTSAFSFR